VTVRLGRGALAARPGLRRHARLRFVVTVATADGRRYKTSTRIVFE
jgi:hypothetical protein